MAGIVQVAAIEKTKFRRERGKSLAAIPLHFEEFSARTGRRAEQFSPILADINYRTHIVKFGVNYRIGFGKASAAVDGQDLRRAAVAEFPYDL